MRMLVDIFGQTLRTLWAHKMRSFLTMFGIAWGVGSLLLLVGLGEGFRAGQRKQLSTMGQNIMFIFPGRVPAAPGSHTGMRPYMLTFDDYVAIRNEAKYIRDVAPVLMRSDIRVVSDFNNTNGQVTGTTPNFADIRYLPMDTGRWLNELDDQQKNTVAVIGDEMNRNLFPGRPAVGSTILLNGIRFQVVGVLSSVGKNENNTTNFRVFVPYHTMHQYFPLKGENKENSVSFINFRPRTRDEHELAKMEVRKIIARQHGFDWRDEQAFEDWDTIMMEQMVGKIFDAMNMFLGGVGLVTLALGAIGIINIMLVSVSERTKEIGLRKALGATNRVILTQFFLEGAFLTLLSGGIGIGAAAGIMGALGLLPAPEGFDTPKLVASSAMLAVTSLSLAGIVAGLYPARKAALLEPVEALRKD
ncbi:MAG TPA: ABC transporter permease [Terriglobales bacterium]|nr:ABC transporter permease [Terriglobales bacterium]